MEIKPLLIVGVPRSGTTWLGKMISLSDYYQYVPEFINPLTGIYQKEKPFEWFQYINNCNFGKFELYFNNLLNFKYKDERNIRIDKKLKEKATNYYYYYKKELKGFPLALLKDPLLSFSGRFIASKYNCTVIAIIRHPAAVVASFKRKNWNIDFTPILNQQILINDLLFDFEDVMNKAKGDIVENVSLLWKIVNSVILDFGKDNNWIIVRHEDLTINSKNEFNKLFKQIGIPFTKKIENKVFKSTHGLYVLPPNNDGHYLVRDGYNLVKNWKKELENDEIKKIKKITAPIWQSFYDETEW